MNVDCGGRNCTDYACWRARAEAAEKKSEKSRCVNCKHWSETRYSQDWGRNSLRKYGTVLEDKYRTGACDEFRDKVEIIGADSIEVDGDFGCVLFSPAAPGEKEGTK